MPLRTQRLAPAPVVTLLAALVLPAPLVAQPARGGAQPEPPTTHPAPAPPLAPASAPASSPAPAPAPAPRPPAPSAVTARSEQGGASAVATIMLDGPDERPPARDDHAPSHRADTPTLLHGFRLGYVFVANHDEPTQSGDPGSSLAARHGLENPHHFLLGYEVMNRLAGSGWLNVLLIGNFSITGLEQSKLFPSANLLLGFELDRSFQAGVGINLMPVDDKPAHMIIAAGWTPRAGDVYLPLHVFLIPDIDSNHRLGTTFGVNWEI